MNVSSSFFMTVVLVVVARFVFAWIATDKIFEDSEPLQTRKLHHHLRVVA